MYMHVESVPNHVCLKINEARIMSCNDVILSIFSQKTNEVPVIKKISCILWLLDQFFGGTAFLISLETSLCCA